MSGTITTRRSRWAAGLISISVAAVGLVVVGGAGTADAALTCTTRATTKAFAAWGDTNQYFPVQDGVFESTTTTWAYRGGASTVLGNEPWKVVSTAHLKALQLPAGASGTTASFCVASDEDALRFFVKSPGTAGAKLHVHIDVVSGVNRATNDYDVSGLAAGWSPTQRIMLPDIRDANGQQWVTISFTAVTGTWAVDDVMIDPWRLF